MKKLLVSILVLCSLSSTAQIWKSVKGNGHIQKETRNIGSFNSLISNGSINVKISYGSPKELTIQADENLLPYVETNLQNGTLTIKSKNNTNLRSKTGITVFLSMDQIKSLKLSGSGKIIGNGAFTNDDKTIIAISGSGNLSLNFDTFKDLDLFVSGSGNIKLNGNSKTMSAHISGSGNIDCSDTRTNDITASISGSGNIKVYADNSVDASISGSGNVFYSGNPQKIERKVSGSGKVIKM
jgi:Putative auto-transporter adhesin, head GIN domain